MPQVTITRCPECQNIKRLAVEAQRELSSDKELNVRVMDGAIGEFTIAVEGETVVTNSDGMLPSIQEIKNSVRVKRRSQPVGSALKRN